MTLRKFELKKGNVKLKTTKADILEVVEMVVCWWLFNLAISLTMLKALQYIISEV